MLYISHVVKILLHVVYMSPPNSFSMMAITQVQIHGHKMYINNTNVNNQISCFRVPVLVG